MSGRSDRQTSSPGTGHYITRQPLLLLFPRRPTDLFRYSAEEYSETAKGGRFVRIKENEALRDFCDVPTGNSPAPEIPYYDYGPEKEPLRLKEREFIVFAKPRDISVRDMTLCFLQKEIGGAYSYYSKLDENSTRLLRCYNKLRLCIEDNETGKNIYLQYPYGPFGRSRPIESDIDIPLSVMNEQYMLRFQVCIDNGEELPDTEQKFKITASVVQNIAGSEWGITRSLPLTYSPYQGWTLAKEDGELRQGRTGWLIDENNYYILKDGRRLPETHMTEDELKDLRIGAQDVKEGLIDILEGVPESELIQVGEDVPPNRRKYILDKYNTHEQLLEAYGDNIKKLVVYQALQINACYNKNPYAPLTINNNAVYYSIGEDETKIPIVATMVGTDGPNKKKLVIAGPHGDERNAQRLIMAAQKHFIGERPLPDTVLYFIPCLSPTMCFADARGIPNEFWKDGRNGIPMENGLFELTESLTIPALHNIMTYRMRDQLQKQTDPTKPNVGIDANRDYYLSLSSNQTFLKFINTICSGLIISQSNIIEATREKREEIATKILSRDVRVLMLHGYDIGERVYGPYWVDSRDSNNWKVDTTDSDKAHIDKIIGNEGLRLTRLSN